MSDRAISIFDGLGLEIAAQRAGMYFKSAPDLGGFAGCRWWLSTLASKNCDRFGVQLMTPSTQPNTMFFVENGLRDRFKKKISGQRVEWYREVDFLVCGAPDMAALKSTQQEVLQVFEDAKSRDMGKSDTHVCNDIAPQSDASSVIFNSFTPTFSYRVTNGQPADETVLDEALWEASGVTYARTNGQTVVYVGKCDGPLKSRIKDHLRRLTRYTKPKDIAYRDWAENRTITIYAHRPPPTNYLGLSVPVHVGLEQALIDEINPHFVSRR